MVTSELLTGLINAQISRELGNRLLYLHIASWFHNQGLKRLAKFFTGEAEGEQGHADRFMGYLREANTQVAVPSIEAKQASFRDADEIANLYIEAEAITTQYIDALWDVAVAEKDWSVQDLLQWFSREQTEEEGLAERFASLANLSNGDLVSLDLAFGD